MSSGSKPENAESRMEGAATDKASALGADYNQYTGEDRTENGTKEHTQGKDGQDQGREHGEGKSPTQGPVINDHNKEGKEAERDEGKVHEGEGRDGGKVPEGEGRGVGEESERERRETSAGDKAGLQQSCAVEEEGETEKQDKEGDEEGK